ncbi:MAG: Kazal-type serine protease inhibitor [Myxococcota bacterium]
MTCSEPKLQGRCVTPVGKNCSAQYKLVCGCDGKTYSNACEAWAAAVDVKAKGVC